MNLELLFSMTISFNYSTVYDKNPIQKNGKTTVAHKSQYYVLLLKQNIYHFKQIINFTSSTLLVFCRKEFLKISQFSKENDCVGVSFLKKFQVSDL